MSTNPSPEWEDDEPPGLAGTVLRGVGYAAGGFALAQALNLGFYIALARLLSPSEFGTYAAATVLLGFTLLMTEGGLVSAVVQRRDRVEEAQSTAVVATITAGVVFSILSAAVSPLIGLLFDSSEVTVLAAAMSGTILLTAIGAVPEAILQRRFSFLRRLVIEPIQVVVFGTVAVVCAVKGLGPWSLVIGNYAGFAVSSGLAWALVRWRPQRRLVSFAMWRELVAFGRHIFTSTAILQLGEQVADTAIVGRGLGTAPLGQYRYAFRIAATPFQLLLAGASYVIFPALSRIATDRERLRGAFLRSLRWMCIFGFPAGLILIPLGPALAVLVFGDVWRPAGEAAIAMCLYTGAGAITSITSEGLKADGRPDMLVRMHAITTGVTAGSMLALLPLGLTAVAAGLSLGGVAGALYALRATRLQLGVPLRSTWREIWPPALAGTVMALVLLPLDRLVLDPTSHGTFAGLCLVGLEGLAGAAIFTAAMHLLAPHSVAEFVTEIRARIAARTQGATQ
ncbi:MAG: lipopolysaccharide biosynthesis protein [Solirubrobacterales bacterium]